MSSETIFVEFGGFPAVSPGTLYDECIRLNIPVTDWIHKANSYKCPAGPEPGVGYILLLKKHIDLIDFNEEYDLEIGTISGGNVVSAVFRRMNPVKAYALTPSVQSDSNAELDQNVVYLMEFNDRRGNARKIPCDIQINVIAPDSDSDTPYYDKTKNYTWDSAISTLWDINGKLGQYPGLPYEPVGVPEGYQFVGVSSYDALNTLLAKINCALIYNPLLDLFSIVQLGAVDAAFNIAEENNFDKLLLDRQPVNSYRNKIASSVKVYFAKRHKYYGLEDTTPASINQWITQGWYSIIIKGDDVGIDTSVLEENSAEIFWDDLTAIQDENEQITNLEELQARATDVANTYYTSAISGINRLNKIYSGALTDFIPGSQLRCVNWYVTYSPHNQINGVYTETLRVSGFPVVRVESDDPNIIINQYEEVRKTENLQPPDYLRHTYPNYFPQIQIINVDDGTPILVNGHNFYDASIEWLDPETIDFFQPEKVWAYKADNTGEQIDNNKKYFGKVSGTIEINGEKRQLYCLVAPCCDVVDLVLVQDENPVKTYNDWYLFLAYIITYKPDNTLGFIRQIDQNNPVYLITNKGRIPDLNIPYLGKVIGFYNKTPVYKTTIEPTRPISFITGTPIKPGSSIFDGKSKITDFDTFTTQSDVDGEKIWIKYIDDVTDLQPDTKDGWVFDPTDVFLGTYKGFHSEAGDLRPLYYIRPNVMKVGQTYKQGVSAASLYSDITYLQFDSTSFSVTKVDDGTHLGKHSVLIKGNPSNVLSSNTFSFVILSNNNLVLPPTITPFTEYKLFNTLGNIFITGIIPPYNPKLPQVVTLVNTSPYTITLLNNSDSSDPDNRFILPVEYGGSLTLGQFDSVTLWYNLQATLIGWYVTSTTVIITPTIDLDTSCKVLQLVVQDIKNLVLPITVTPLTEYNLTGFSGGTIIRGIVPQVIPEGPQIITLINVAPNPITIISDDITTTIGNQIILPPKYGASVDLQMNDTITLWYDSCAINPGWYQLACTVDIDDTNPDLDTSCYSYAFTSGGVDDAVLPATQTPLTEYNIVANYGGTNLTGITPQIIPEGPQIITLINTSSNLLTIINEGGSQAGHKIKLPPTYGGSVALKANDTITLWYNSCISQPAWYVLACTVDTDSSNQLLTENIDLTDVVANTTTITANNDQGTKAFGRIHFNSSGNTNELNWQGLMIYLAGTGYVGPEPDIEFVPGTNVTLSVADDVVNKRTKLTINAATQVITSCNTPSALATTNNNYALPTITTPFTELNMSAAGGGSTVTGIVPQTITAGPIVITLINTSANSLIISNNSASSLAANRIILPPTYGSSVTLAQNDTITLWYDSCAAQPSWYVWACTVDPDSSGGVTGTYYTSALSPTTSVSTSPGTWTNVLTITLTVGGTYVIHADACGSITSTSSSGSVGISARLFDGNAAAAIANSTMLIYNDNSIPTSKTYDFTASCSVIVTVAGGDIITLQGNAGTSTPGISGSIIGGGQTRLTAIRIA